MSILSSLRTPAIPLLALGLFLVGCASKDDISPAAAEQQAFEDLRSVVRDVLDDPARESEVIAVVDALSADLAALRERISERTKRARELNADYDTTRDEFEAFFNQVDRQIQSNKRQVSERQRALFAILSTEERSAIGKVHTRAMDAAIRNLQAI